MMFANVFNCVPKVCDIIWRFCEIVSYLQNGPDCFLVRTILHDWFHKDRQRVLHGWLDQEIREGHTHRQIDRRTEKDSVPGLDCLSILVADLEGPRQGRKDAGREGGREICLLWSRLRDGHATPHSTLQNDSSSSLFRVRSSAALGANLSGPPHVFQITAHI